MPKKQQAKGGGRRRKQHDPGSDEDNAADKLYGDDYRKPRLVEDGNVSSDEDEEISFVDACNSGVHQILASEIGIEVGSIVSNVEVVRI